MSGSNIAFVLTGSIAGYKACDAISRLVQGGHQVRTVATPSALRFVGAATLEGLTGHAVLTDLFQPGAAMEHIQLTRWADLVIVCPATANVLNRFAAGLSDDLAGALFLAHDRSKPFLVAPAMNPAMWSHPATAESAEKLMRWGVRFVSVGDGRTACGEIGEGRLAEPPEIVAAVEAALAKPVRRLRVLVTSGGTAEPVDGVRVLTNTSTGKTGAAIAAGLQRAGHEVVMLRSEASVPAPAGCAESAFVSFADLDAALNRILTSVRFDAVIHAAAVSDYSVREVIAGNTAHPPGRGKIESDAQPLIRLRRNPKLVDSLRVRAGNESLKIVAFKLVQGAAPDDARRAVDGLFEHSGADVVVLNDLSRRCDADVFPSEIHFSDGRPAETCDTRAALAAALERILAAYPASEAVPA